MKSRRPSAANEADDEDRRKRVECSHQTGQVFESMADLKWLYFDLTLRGAFEKTEFEKQSDALGPVFS